MFLHDLLYLLKQLKLVCIVGTPDVLAVHDACKQERPLRKTALNELKRLDSFDEVDADAVETEGDDFLINVANVAKVSLQGNLQVLAVNLLDEAGINFVEQGLFFGVHVENQGGFRDRNPCGTSGCKLVGKFNVRLHGVSCKVFRVFLAVVAGEAKEGVNADEARHGLDAGSLGFVVFLDGLVARKGDHGRIVNFRDNVVVVGVEPLFHGERLHVTFFALVTMGCGKIGFEGRNA